LGTGSTAVTTTSRNMTKSDKVLVILLRVPGGTALFALVAVFIPVS
jgi:hypothetical protein